jgi:hypothetical protein
VGPVGMAACGEGEAQEAAMRSPAATVASKAA